MMNRYGLVRWTPSVRSLVINEDLLRVCGGDSKKAVVLSILLECTESKRDLRCDENGDEPEGDGTYPFHKSMSDICELALETVCREKVAGSIESLESDGILIVDRSTPGEMHTYTLLYQKLQGLIDAAWEKEYRGYQGSLR